MSIHRREKHKLTRRHEIKWLFARWKLMKWFLCRWRKRASFLSTPVYLFRTWRHKISSKTECIGGLDESCPAPNKTPFSILCQKKKSSQFIDKILECNLLRFGAESSKWKTFTKNIWISSWEDTPKKRQSKNSKRTIIIECGMRRVEICISSVCYAHPFIVCE